MRLSPKTRQAIVELFQQYFPKGKLYLFGSRADPNARGGDIDLLCEMEGDSKELINKRSAFLIALEKRIGEQKIDFVLYQPSENPDLKIAQIAKKTGVRIDMNDDIELSMETADRHNKRLTWAIKKMANIMPLTADRFEKLTDDELAFFDVFSTRFSKLQNILGTKVLPAILEVTQEPGEYPTFIDKLNRLEKMGAIPSADEWTEFREIRNQFTHDYPDDPQLNANLLNNAYTQGKKLQSTFAYIKKYIQKNIKKA